MSISGPKTAILNQGVQFYLGADSDGPLASASAFASCCRLIAMLFALLTALGSVPAAISVRASPRHASAKDTVEHVPRLNRSGFFANV